MGTIFAYSIYSSILLMAMYLIYKWLLSGERQLAFNRGVLLAIYAVALVAPSFALGFPRHGDAATVLIDGIDVSVAAEAFTGEESSDPEWPVVLLAAYLAGVVLCIAHTLIVAFRLAVIVRKGERKPLQEGYTLILTDDGSVAPFSWWKYVVMSRRDYKEYGDVILIHELRHLGASHWSDLLLAQLVAIFQWYNPAAWLMREELKTVHEYQADDAVMRSGADIESYHMLLIRKAVGARFPSLANSLNHSQLKKRITMMYKKSSSKGRRMRSLALVPAVVAALLATNIPAVGSLLREASMAEISLPEGKVTEKSAERQTLPATTGSVVSIKGSGEGSVASASKDQMDYYIDGKLSTKDEMSSLKNDEIASVTVNKQAGAVYIDTKANASAGSSQSSQAKQSVSGNEAVYTTVEEMPRFPGGEAVMMRYVAQNMKYPETAMKADKQGRVVVRFTVSSTGKVQDPQIVRSVDADLDAEALRVVSTLPDFIPGKVDGKPVSVSYTMPISFRLSKDEPAAPKK